MINEINNRLCPSEEILSEYLTNGLSDEERKTAEEHLINCDSCRRIIAETYEILKTPNVSTFKRTVLSWLKQNIWISSSAFFLVLSFFMHKYFLQFLTLALLAGSKWIVDKRAVKMMFIQKEIKKEGKPWKQRSK